MREIKVLLNLLINYIENLYKMNYLRKANTKVFVKFLLNMLMKTKTNLFYKH